LRALALRLGLDSILTILPKTEILFWDPFITHLLQNLQMRFALQLMAISTW
jgi:hypothetical protein